MASGILMHSFNWNGFQALITPPAHKLAAAVVELIREQPWIVDLSTFEEEYEKEPAEALSEFYSGTDWYGPQTELEDEDVDDLVQRIFETKLPELEMELLTGGIDFLIPPFVAGIMTAKNKSGRTVIRKNSKKTDAESQWLGCRPYRYPNWDGNAAQDFNPFSGEGTPTHSPQYSLHSPEEVHKMYQEATSREKEVQQWEDEALISSFESDFLETLEVAANNNLAIFAVSDC